MATGKHQGTRVVLEGKANTVSTLSTLDALSTATNLSGKVVLVTGAGSGIGKAFALKAAKLGAKLVLGDRNGSEVKEVAQTIDTAGGQAVALQADVTNWDELSALFDEGERAFGVIDAVVPNAGILEAQSLLNHDPAGAKPSKPNVSTIEINLIGVIYTVKLAFYYLKKNPSKDGKSITLIGSMASHVGLATANLYSTSKHGVLGLFKSTYWDAKAHGISLNVICPWFVKTPLLTPELLAAITGLETASVEDVVAAIVHSASDRDFSGKIVCVDADGILVCDHPSWANGEDQDYGVAISRAAGSLAV